jgi:crotonobetainyl-CoA:carnitine CoA-transferase CaiB-like acyl-CoA transferase
MLEGLRVLELGDHAAFAGRLLASMGATVIKEEATADVTDPILRRWRDGGKAVGQVSAQSSPDVPPVGLVLDGRVVGDDPDLDVAAPVVRVTPFGETGPWAGWQASEIAVQAASGLMAVDGYDDPDAPPVMCAGHQAEVVGGTMAAIAGLLLLEGVGSAAATSWHEALSVGHETEFTAWTARGERYRRHAGQHASVDEDPRRWQWRCADGKHINLILPALTRERWAALVTWLDESGMAADLTDDRWLKGRVRLDEEKHIFEVLGAFVATMKAEEAFSGGQERDLPWGPVRRPEENLDDPQFAARPILATGEPWRVHVGPPSDRRPRPMKGMRVLDLTWQVAGTTITRILAHAGADVVKVERPGRPELMRVMSVGTSGLYDGDEPSPFFRNLNAGKRSLALDLSTERDTFLRLVARADLVVENFSSRVMDRLGLGFETLREANPAVVYCSLSGFGHEGPKRDYDTWGPTAQAISGMTWLSQLPGREPAGFGYSFLDYVGGYVATVGLLGALQATRADGCARWVDASQVEVGLACASLALLDPTAISLGNDGPVVRAGDGRWVAGLDHDEVGDDAYAAVGRAQAAGRAASVVQEMADRFERDPQLAHLGTFPVVAGHPYEATPIRIDGRTLPISGPAPALGQHTDEVLAQWLS